MLNYDDAKSIALEIGEKIFDVMNEHNLDGKEKLQVLYMLADACVYTIGASMEEDDE